MDKEWSSDVVLAGSTSDWCKRLPKAETNWPAGVIAAWKTLSGGSSLSLEQGLELYAEPDLASVGELAAMVKSSRFGTHVFFNSNVHVNQTNICVLACKFCAFRRGRKAKDAYAMDIETYLSEVGKLAAFTLIGESNTMKNYSKAQLRPFLISISKPLQQWKYNTYHVYQIFQSKHA
jgi:hypothetical protein